LVAKLRRCPWLGVYLQTPVMPEWQLCANRRAHRSIADAEDCALAEHPDHPIRRRNWGVEAEAWQGHSCHWWGSLVGSLINLGLVDELRVVVEPILLGAGKALFWGVTGRYALTLGEATPIGDGTVRLTYGVGAG
jgi:hypothetical protein